MEIGLSHSLTHTHKKGQFVLVFRFLDSVQPLDSLSGPGRDSTDESPKDNESCSSGTEDPDQKLQTGTVVSPGFVPPSRGDTIIFP